MSVPALRQPQLANRLHALLSIGGAALLALVLRWPFLHLPLERDEGAYGYVAWQWLHGAVLYRDVWDHKPPLIHALYALMWLGSEPSAFVVRVWATGWFVVGVALVYLLGARLWDRMTAGVAVGLYAVAGSAFGLQGMVFNTEQALVVPALLSLWFLLRWLADDCWYDALLYGVLLTVVALIKPTAVPLLFGLIALGLRRPLRQWLQGVALVVVGAVFAVLPWIVYFALHGAWSDAVFALVTYNRRYLAESQTQWNVGALVNLLVPFAPLAFTALGGVALAAERIARQRLALVGWTVAFATAAVASLRPYVHYYYPLLPGLALLAAASIMWLIRQPHKQRVIERWAHHLAPTLLVLLLILPHLFDNLGAARLSPAAQSQRLYGDDGLLFAQAADVAAFIEQHTPPDAPVWVWGAEPEIYLLARRPSIARYSFDYPLILFPNIAADVGDQLQRNPPAGVITYAGVRPVGFDELVTGQGLVLLQRIGGFEVWGRKL